MAKALSLARDCVRLAPAMKNVVPSSTHLTMYLQGLFGSTVIILLYAMHVHDPKASTVAMEEARAMPRSGQVLGGCLAGREEAREAITKAVTAVPRAEVGCHLSPLNSSPQPGPASLRQGPTVQVLRQERVAKRNVRPRSQDARSVHEWVVGSEGNSSVQSSTILRSLSS